MQPQTDSSADPTRAQLIAELEAFRAAALEHVSSLRNQSAPALIYASDQQRLAAIHETSKE